ncbi:interleukin-1 receptor-like 1 [Hypomesus transpacificus]|uniref:interleukin-1 receptor-like 1 n=1 Tax=Hypomesus transpacificus TaxID=137520 RepID=UPI001F075DF3|nr:interleukin-1 receptor-like 1 [Hypomesus transpacificus]
MSVPIREYLMLALAWVSTCGEVTEPPDESLEELSWCLPEDEGDRLQVLEGEGLRLHAKVSNDALADVTDPRWYRDGTEEISSSEGQRVHQHGSLLLFLPLLLNDSEHYYSYGRASPDRCFLSVTKVIVLPAEPRPRVLFSNISESSVNIDIKWPNYKLGECEGNFSWYRNLRLLPSEKSSLLWVRNATKADEANYTCVCTWTHNQEVYNSSASRWLNVKEPLAYYPPIINTPANGSTETAVMGSIKTLTCSAHCGTNIKDCWVWWNVNGQKADDLEGYSQNLTSEYVTTKKLYIFKSVLTIDRVSVKDFHSTFKCNAMTDQSITVAALFLKPEASLLLPLVGGVCILLLALPAALAVRHFAIDLALFFRWLLRSYSCPEDGKVYDAYVAYQRQGLDQAMEERLGLFVTSVLPYVLENQCGLRLFIHGRDNLPGEDCMELAERCIRLSRRLMVILTPTSGSGSEVKGPGAALQYDWQLGLHHALMQSGVTVILIQLGDMSFTHLPPTLQLLIRSSTPLRWNGAARGATTATSAFWKRVRYLMPSAAPASRQGHQQSHQPSEILFLNDRP